MQLIRLLSGPLTFCLFHFGIELDSGNPEVSTMAGIALWMALWWIFEAIPLGVTALLPAVLFPLFSILGTKETAVSYMNHIIFLFIGGFLIAFAMEKWNLHKRIALKLILLVGTDLNRILLGVMLSSFFLSMWISNMATTMMLLPTVLALMDKLGNTLDSENGKKVKAALLVSIAYSASIGGTTTLIGTAPNMVLMGQMDALGKVGDQLHFASWMMFSLPIAIAFLTAAYFLLKYMFFRNIPEQTQNNTVFEDEYRSLGRLGYEEKLVGILFLSAALLWLTRADMQIGETHISGWASLLPNPKFITDGTVAIFISIALFLIPSKGKKEALIGKTELGRLPYEIILLFGGGFALAKGVGATGLSSWMAGQFSLLDGLSPILITLIVCTFMTFVTELTSNTATTQLIIPILASMAVALNMDPIYLLLPATLSASFAFMLPVATPPNMIVFGSGQIPQSMMIRAGFWLNLIGIAILTIGTYMWGGVVFGN